MNADRVARIYRWLEYAAFGTALERARFEFLSHTVEARRVLILGEGDGRFLARLLECNREASVAVVDTSARMIELARARLANDDRARVEFHHRNAANGWLPCGPFDLVVTHFFLDVLDESGAAATIANLSSLVSPGARWLISEFQVPDGGLRALHARIWLSVMYRFFAVTTGLRTTKLPAYRERLTCAGFSEIDYRERRLGLIRSQAWRKNS
jgi:SAM-dependent methyltransferase